MAVNWDRRVVLAMAILFISIICSVLIKIVATTSLLSAFLYSDYISCDHNKDLNLDVSETVVYFYDFQNNFNLSYNIKDAAEGIIGNYNLDTTRRLIFFVPGYKVHISKNSPEVIRQAFRDVPDIYLMIVDHSAYTSLKEGRLKSYENAVMYTYYIGQALGEFLSQIHAKGYPSRNIHCVGQSLGSQILGFTGTSYFTKTNEKVWRITGLDPAGPCFSNSFIEDQLRSGCAEYVEVYHCNAGGLGTTSVLADIDFFFNDAGRRQPHCHAGIIPGLGASDAARCSHKACTVLWAKTVANPGWYLAWACDSYKHFWEGKCAGNEVTIAGYSNPGNATGMFYVATGAYEGY